MCSFGIPISRFEAVESLLESLDERLMLHRFMCHCTATTTKAIVLVIGGTENRYHEKERRGKGIISFHAYSLTGTQRGISLEK